MIFNPGVSLLFYIPVIICVITDIKSGIIPNRYTFLMMVTGILCGIFQGADRVLWEIAITQNPQVNGFFFAVAGILTAFLIFYPFYVFGVFKGGDGKLAMGFGAFMGVEIFLTTLVFVFAYGFLTALITLVKRKKLKEMLHQIYAKYILHINSLEGEKTETEKGTMYPYAVNFLLGALTVDILSRLGRI